MSYLHPLRLHFAGRFQASVSTVNNDPSHFDNAAFQPAYQLVQGPGMNPPNGWFNPNGDADWRLIGCRVTAAWLDDVTPAATSDPVLQMLVADADSRVAAKLVDLDPEQQLVSEVWGLEVRLCDATGATRLRGHFDPAGFMEIWDRSSGGGGDVGAGAMFQSVLTRLEWGQIEDSPFLQRLRAAAIDGVLSIKFNVDGFNLDGTSPEFMRGRIVGTIGPATTDEPRHLVVGRQFMATAAPGGNFFTPAGGINFCVAVVDEAAGKIRLDLGNALPTTVAGGDPADLGALSLACQVATDNGTVTQALGTVAYRDAGWYARTAGIVVLPSDRKLTADELRAIAANPLALQLTDTSGKTVTAIGEAGDGLWLRADRFVFRLNPGEVASARLHATRWGRPLAGARIVTIPDSTHLQDSDAPFFSGPVPRAGVPIEALEFAVQAVTDAAGIATLPIHAKAPGNPRRYLDGQVYGVRSFLEEALASGTAFPTNPGHFVSLLVWDRFEADQPPTWFGSRPERGLAPIFQQYANLYPIMKRFLDMGDYESVCTHRRLLSLAFGLDPADPNSMPVTRDLSSAKRRAILRWLAHPGPDGKPLRGTPPPAPAAPPPSPPPAASRNVISVTAPAAEAAVAAPRSGGKSAAAARRRAVATRYGKSSAHGSVEGGRP